MCAREGRDKQALRRFPCAAPRAHPKTNNARRARVRAPACPIKTRRLAGRRPRPRRWPAPRSLESPAKDEARMSRRAVAADWRVPSASDGSRPRCRDRARRVPAPHDRRSGVAFTNPGRQPGGTSPNRSRPLRSYAVREALEMLADASRADGAGTDARARARRSARLGSRPRPAPARSPGRRTTRSRQTSGRATRVRKHIDISEKETAVQLGERLFAIHDERPRRNARHRRAKERIGRTRRFAVVLAAAAIASSRAASSRALAQRACSHTDRMASGRSPDYR